MKLYRTDAGIFLELNNDFFSLGSTSWDEALAHNNLFDFATSGNRRSSLDGLLVLAPIGSQEVWAAGVTYFRSRTARMEESKTTGGDSFYDRVYHAERPELFFKSMPHRVVGTGSPVRIRADATWSVPEPELALVLSPQGKITGYTIGNDMSSRDIEGENPLYLPQAKVYDGSCALGPCVLLAEGTLRKDTGISIHIERSGSRIFTGQTTLAELKRDPQELADYLFRELTFPQGAYLMTGTGVVPEDDFTLAHGDTVRISIEDIGILENIVA